MARKKVEPNSNPAPAGTNQGEKRLARYVVIREGHRVSANEYGNPHDPLAHQEVEFWTRVEQRHSWGAPVGIVLYDNKLHRVW
jgi:tRNA(Arg) A34 adenosine deaminase TadA